jgi:hypothetical protein
MILIYTSRAVVRRSKGLIPQNRNKGMDISVSRLNNRMILQVPAELPLGLVSIVGQVHGLEVRDGETRLDLVEAGHSLQCRLTQRLAEEVLLKNGDTVRAGGHLAFDVQSAQYYLLARAIEVEPGMVASRRQMAPILADIRKRADVAALVRAELPPWVKRLAPPEVQAELALMEQGQTATASGEPEIEREGGASGSAASISQDEEMIAFLSAAMDREDEVELTPDVLAQFLPVDLPLSNTDRAAPDTAAGTAQSGFSPAVGGTLTSAVVPDRANLTDRLLMAAIALLIIMLLLVLLMLFLTLL